MRYAVLSVLLSVLATVRGQTAFPFPDSAALWVQSWSLMVTQPPMPQFEVMGISNIFIPGTDTLIDGTTYSKVEQFGMDYIGALREDAGRVFFQPADSLEDFLLYDFTLEVGDTVHDVYVDGGLAFNGWSDYPELVDYLVTEVGEVQGRTFVRLVQPPLPGGPDQVWIEGFGSPWGLFSQQDPINVSGYDAGLGCMSHRDTSWYFNEWVIDSLPGNSCIPQYVGYHEAVRETFRVHPNPTADILSVQVPTDCRITELVLSDPTGIPISVPRYVAHGQIELDMRNQPPGIYLLQLRSADRAWTSRVVKM